MLSNCLQPASQLIWLDFLPHCPGLVVPARHAKKSHNIDFNKNSGAVAVAGGPAVAGDPSVAGGPAVTGFPAVEGVLAVASVPANPGVHILAGGFTSWIVE